MTGFVLRISLGGFAFLIALSAVAAPNGGSTPAISHADCDVTLEYLGKHEAYDAAFHESEKFWEHFNLWLKTSSFSVASFDGPLREMRDDLFKKDIRSSLAAAADTAIKWLTLGTVKSPITRIIRRKRWKDSLVDATLFHNLREYGVLDTPQNTMEDIERLMQRGELFDSMDKVLDMKAGKAGDPMAKIREMKPGKAAAGLNKFINAMSMGHASFELRPEHLEWLDEHLKHAANVIPAEVLRAGGYNKLVKTLLGVVAYRIHFLQKKGAAAAEYEPELFKAIQAGFYFGITYPLWDDVMDSKQVMSGSQKKEALALVIKGLSGKTLTEEDVPDHQIAREMKKSFDALLELFPYDTNRDLYDSLLILTFSQAEDGNHAFSRNIGDIAMYVPLILKAAYSRVVVADLTANRSAGFMDNALMFGLFNQLTDDFRDFPSDLKEGNVTPFTYYVSHGKTEKLPNPLEIYFGILEYIAGQYQNPFVRELLLRRVQRSIQSFAHEFGKAAFDDYMAKLGIPGTKTEALLRSLARAGKDYKDAESTAYSKVSNIYVTENHKNRKPSLKSFLGKHQDEINEMVRIKTTSKNVAQNELIRSMNYSLDGSGKRMRPLLVLIAADLFGVPEEKVQPLGRAIELLHTASLILDDLPAQDNAGMRRGRETNHRVFPEATSQLAAVSLISEAFKELTHLNRHFPPEMVLEMIDYYSFVTGHEGLSYGQMKDLDRHHSQLTANELDEIIHLKTGLAIEASLVPVAKLAGVPAAEIESLKSFAHALGQVFQIRDDILDAEGDAVTLGKDVQRDSANDTRNFVSIYGLSGAKQRLAEMRAAAEADLRHIPRDTSLLKELLDYAADRKK